MEATLHMGLESHFYYDGFYKTQTTGQSFTMSILNNSDNRFNSETFHTPSFGDEDFNISPYSVNQTYNSESHHQNYISNYNQPLTHQLMSDPPPYPNPKFPPQTIDIPEINYNHMPQDMYYNAMYHQQQPQHQQHQNLQHNGLVQYAHAPNNLPPPPNPLTPSHSPQQLNIPQQQVNNNNNNKNKMEQRSPTGSNNTSSPGRESSEESSSSDDSLPLAQVKQSAAQKRPASESNNNNTTPNNTTKKPKTPKKRKKKDPNEPQKPVSAYALFFRDTQAAIKGQNPNASFGEVSKIVASMWDNLDVDQKNIFKKRTETAKKEYLKQLAAYRASLVSKQSADGSIDTQTLGVVGGKTAMPGHMTPHTTAPPLSHYTPPGSSSGNLMMAAPPMMSAMHPALLQAPHQQQQQQQQHRPPAMSGHPAAHNPNLPHPMQPLNMPNNQGQGYSGMEQGPGALQSPVQHGMCIRQGCSNQAVDNPSWDNEYCSNECVVSHCRDVFTAWVAHRQQTNNTYASVK